ncbi:MAG TPA: hypothetical protein VG368_02400 [Acidimicrobiales bacterium]|jgi:hypothetical protein|nr:hypothetical protein [Acidimicrobiales bacterium]
MRGRWAAGIAPRNFCWIIQDQLAVSERPGGQAQHHRPVRRQEEIIWLTQQGFSRVVSLLPSNHNLHAYDERGLPSSHFPLALHSDPRETLDALYPALLGWLRDGERILVHEEQLSERLAGVLAGFLCWSRLIPQPPRAITAIEHLLRRQMGAAGRSIVAIVGDLTPPASGPVTSALRPVELDVDGPPTDPDHS